MAELKPYKGEFYLWQYVPSKIAAMIFIALFILSTLTIMWRMIRTRTFFSIPFLLGGILEAIGYCGRAMATEHTDILLPFVIQQIFILVAPALLAASIYMTLGRVIRSVKGESLAIIPVRWLTRLFVLGDIVSFVVQVFGGGMAAKENANIKLAENIIIAGLMIQIIIFGLFAVTTIIFHVRLNKWPVGVAAELNPVWRKNIAMMYMVSGLIMVRSVFRVVEYIMGGKGYLLRHEWPLYIFDATLMFLSTVYYAWYYPGNLRVKKGGPGNWDTVGSSPGTSSGLEMKNQQPPPHVHVHQQEHTNQYHRQAQFEEPYQHPHAHLHQQQQRQTPYDSR